MTDEVAYYEIYHSPVISASSVFGWAACLLSYLSNNYIFKNKLQFEARFHELPKKTKIGWRNNAEIGQFEKSRVKM